MSRHSSWIAVLAGALVGALSWRAAAQIELGRLVGSRSQLSSEQRKELLKALNPERSERVSLLVRTPQASIVEEPRLVRVGHDLFALDTNADELSQLADQHPDWRFQWSPPRRLLLDQAGAWLHLENFRAASPQRGKGVVVGIVDTGVDIKHRDLRAGGGDTRVLWLIDFSRHARGKHPELERDYGCSETEPSCAIFDAVELNELVRGTSTADLPADPVGHGTHVASLAVGNGLASERPRYIGVAPEANLIVGRVTRERGATIQDSDILKAVRFVFERAEALGMPAVVNLSLGGDFGAHDGSSELEQGLADFVGPRYPGRAIVVAAGNSAGVYLAPKSGFPQPLGVHTEVHVPRESPTKVPILIPPTDDDEKTARGAVYVWVGLRRGDEVELGVDYDHDSWIEPVPPGKSGAFTRGGLTASVYNGSNSLNSPVASSSYGAVVVLNGAWKADNVIELVLKGQGTAHVWVQSEGGLAPELSVGALLPKAEKQGTITIPASHPALIAVGASVNRTVWTDYTGKFVEMKEHGAFDDVPLDTIAYFSSAGPNAVGLIKPDIIAPGVNVAGAMSALADPRTGASTGVFANGGRCKETDSECFVVDNTHAVTSGTSMAAPLVSGAVALLFERNPTLTQDQVRALLQAGARPLEGAVSDEQQVGVGALNLEGTLAVAIAEDSPIDRVPGSKSWICLGASYAHPDPDWPLVGYVELRDELGKIADGFDPARIKLDIARAYVREPLTRVAPGLWRFSIAAQPDTGGMTLPIRILFDDQAIISRTLPIGVDRWVAEQGAAPRGGCALTHQRTSGYVMLIALALLLGLRRLRPAS